jgi:hypothetical protein
LERSWQTSGWFCGDAWQRIEKLNSADKALDEAAFFVEMLAVGSVNLVWDCGEGKDAEERLDFVAQQRSPDRTQSRRRTKLPRLMRFRRPQAAHTDGLYRCFFRHLSRASE